MIGGGVLGSGVSLTDEDCQSLGFGDYAAGDTCLYGERPETPAPSSSSLSMTPEMRSILVKVAIGIGVALVAAFVVRKVLP